MKEGDGYWNAEKNIELGGEEDNCIGSTGALQALHRLSILPTFSPGEPGEGSERGLDF
ncbi:MAG: hypothetical protein LBF22_06260 [Deltaproteobacteria bacterium]|nr:hypothetical protein [Deltaproteobacteria bacterium]